MPTVEQRLERLGLAWIRGRVEEMRNTARAAERDMTLAERGGGYERARRVFANALRRSATTLEDCADEYEADLDAERKLECAR